MGWPRAMTAAAPSIPTPPMTCTARTLSPRNTAAMTTAEAASRVMTTATRAAPMRLIAANVSVNAMAVETP